MPPDLVGRMLGVRQTNWLPENWDRAHREERSPSMQYDYVRLRLVELHVQELHAEAARARLSRQVPDPGLLVHLGSSLPLVLSKAFGLALSRSQATNLANGPANGQLTAG
jgi:hypothetical protein